ncbi:hypothetical protein D3C87_145740 [compost metagenome]
MKVFLTLFILSYGVFANATPSNFNSTNSGADGFVETHRCSGQLSGEKIAYSFFMYNGDNDRPYSNSKDYALISFRGKSKRFYYVSGSTKDIEGGGYESKVQSASKETLIFQTTASGLILITSYGTTTLICEL